MNLDTTFLSTDEGTAPSGEPTASIDSTPAPEVVTPAPAVEATPAVADPAVVPDPAVEAVADPQVPDEGLNDEEIEKLLADQNSPRWFREQLKKVANYSGKLKAEREGLQSQLTDFQTKFSEYEGKAPLAQTDLERLRAAEERQYKLSSFTSTPDEVLGSLKEVITPAKMAEIKNQLAWEFLEAADGTPDMENLQVIVDRFAGNKEGEPRVNAKDVLNAIQAIKRGTVKPEEFHEFTSDVEYDAYQRARKVESEIESQRQLAADNAKFQESQTRVSVLQNVLGDIQGQFRPQVESMLDKFQLSPAQDEPKVAAEYKQRIRERIAAEVNRVSAENPNLSDVFKAIDLLSKPSGRTADQVRQEIQGYVTSFPYQTAVSRGLSELMSAVEKTVAQEAYHYKLLMKGYEAEVTKGQHAREVIGQPKQTDVLTEYTPEQLAAMSSRERRHTVLQQVSNQLRNGKTPRYGG
jgi:hypothetical protein